VDRKYNALVRRLKVSARRALRIRAASERRALRIRAARGAWARQANRICGSNLREVRAAVAATALVRTRSELVSLLSKIDTIGEDHVAQLRALAPPRHDAPRVERMLELSAQVLATDRAAIAAFGRNDRRSFVRLLKQELRLGKRLDGIAAALGADACTENPFSVDGG
jgi:hypothetical protein